MTVLRIYKPDECDTDGNPLGWLRCRECKSKGLLASRTPGAQMVHACPTCHGHGSLRAAALAKMATIRWGGPIAGDCSAVIPRCEDCQHPQSEGTWEGGKIECPAEDAYRRAMTEATKRAQKGCTPESFAQWKPTHYSRCDENCTHGRPVRYALDLPGEKRWYPVIDDLDAIGSYQLLREASWRPVDVRRLSWPMDLRPESLAVLCLRCWAAR